MEHFCNIIFKYIGIIIISECRIPGRKINLFARNNKINYDKGVT